ncbi:hypothetical protein ACO0LB_10155 [Undibacterium sp. SXout7W]
MKIELATKRTAQTAAMPLVPFPTAKNITFKKIIMMMTNIGIQKLS